MHSLRLPARRSAQQQPPPTAGRKRQSRVRKRKGKHKSRSKINASRRKDPLIAVACQRESRGARPFRAVHLPPPSVDEGIRESREERGSQRKRRRSHASDSQRKLYTGPPSTTEPTDDTPRTHGGSSAAEKLETKKRLQAQCSSGTRQRGNGGDRRRLRAKVSVLHSLLEITEGSHSKLLSHANSVSRNSKRPRNYRILPSGVEGSAVTLSGVFPPPTPPQLADAIIPYSVISKHGKRHYYISILNLCSYICIATERRFLNAFCPLPLQVSALLVPTPLLRSNFSTQDIQGLINLGSS